MLLSIVYPTRDRPSFIEKALNFLEQQSYQKFEVIVCDNYSDERFSCFEICEKSSLNVIYIRPKRELTMVENWNYALSYASGEYVGYFTDKMFLLPLTLEKSVEAIQKELPDIVTWRDNAYYPDSFPHYFKKGVYKRDLSSIKGYEAYIPQEALNSKAKGDIPRERQSRSLYCRGKICFGLYSKVLITKIKEHCGELFLRISPDYTSMVAALSVANKAIELEHAGVVHMNTDLSNGGLNAVDDKRALQIAMLNEPFYEEKKNYLIPHLYVSTNNKVVYDYLLFNKYFDGEVAVSKLHWCASIYYDLMNPDRKWSSEKVKKEQHEIFDTFISTFSLKEKILFTFLKRKYMFVEKSLRLYREKRTRLSRFSLVRVMRTFLNRKKRFVYENIEEIMQKELALD